MSLLSFGNLNEFISLTGKKNLTCKYLRKCRNMLFATCIVTIGSFGTGTVFGWPAVAAADIKKRNEFKGISLDDQIPFVISLAILAALPGSLVAGVLMDAVGRKYALVIFCLPFTIGWGVISVAYYTSIFYFLHAGRVLTGFSAGGCLVIVPTYVRETSTDLLRGVLCTMLPLMLVLGILFAFVIGSFCHWATLSICCGVIPVILVLGTLAIPETPRHHYMKSRKNKAAEAFKWLTDTIEISDDAPVIELLNTLYEREHENASDAKTKKSLRGFFSRPVFTPVLLSLFIFLFQQFGGVNAVTLYTTEIFMNSGGTLDENVATILIGIVQVVFVAISMFVIDTLGRKILLIGSSFLMGCCLISLGTYFYLKEKGDGSEESITWLPVTSACTYVAVYSIGTGSIAWVVATEIFNPEYRGESATVMTGGYWIFGFVVAQTFPQLQSLIKRSGAFWFYGGVCLLGAIFSLFFVPETKSKSTEEIVKYFGGEAGSKTSTLVELAAGDSQRSSIDTDVTQNEPGDGKRDENNLITALAENER